ncbi:uncharacterized protein LOC116255511 [Nymphaea colorata]|nr:uncharacterized protein LOC116255511 [Nymphaea colorata]
MSWLRSAVHRAVEVGGKNTLTRTVRNYADSVVHHAGNAVAEGAKKLQDRMVTRTFKSFKHTVKRLEEASVSCRGPERVQLLQRWLAALKETESMSESSSDKSEKTAGSPNSLNDADLSPRKTSLVLFFDSEVGREPVNFQDVFLHSQALEGITMNMILEGPSDEEVSLLLEIFALALTGGKEIHNAIVSSIQDLSKAFSTYQEEVLVKREELLQFAQGAITGLKLNADLSRIDAEALFLERKLYCEKPPEPSSADGPDEAVDRKASLCTKALKDALAEVEMCSTLEGLLLKKKLTSAGDSPEKHFQKIDKLKILAESLANSTMKAEKRISDNQNQKEEALNFRVAKANEIGEIEKELEAEVAQLEKQRDEIEAELKRVNTSLTATLARLRNTREEREQFDEANKQIIMHLKTKEDELAKSVATCKTEANVVRTWINFLEDTWLIQSFYTEEKEKLTNDELEKSVKHFEVLLSKHLSKFKEALKLAVIDIQRYIEDMNNLGDRLAKSSNSEAEVSEISGQRKNVKAVYLDTEEKIITTFRTVDNMREQFYSHQVDPLRQDDSEIKKAFDAIEEIRRQFESIKRPSLESESDGASPEKAVISPGGDSRDPSGAKPGQDEIPVLQEDAPLPTTGVSDNEQNLDPEAELAKLESEFGSVGRDYSTEEITDWEFDALEQELKISDASSGN